MTKPKEKSIILHPAQILSLLGRGTVQVRRVVKPQLPSAEDVANKHEVSGTYFDSYNGGPSWCFWNKQGQVMNGVQGDGANSCMWRCPYGAPGDRLWVRETFCDMYCTIGNRGRFLYKADQNPSDADISARKGGRGWSPPQHMPYGMHRLDVEVVAVRVEKRGYGWPKNQHLWIGEFKRVTT